jgi:hypothetical protein
MLHFICAFVLLSSIATGCAAPGLQCDELIEQLENMAAGSLEHAALLARAQSGCGQRLDRAALAALYESTNGDGWRHNEGWLSERSHCSDWYGIGCDDSGRVQYLILDHNLLAGPIPSQIGFLANLHYLHLHNNRLTALSPEIGNLSRLRELCLGFNRLSGSIPPEIGQLTELRNLILGHNRLSGSIPSEVGNLTKLRHLYLNDNDLIGVIPSEIGRLRHLQNLILERNELSGPIPPETGAMAELRHLYLGFNQLDGRIPSEIGNLSNLVHLLLDGNRLSGHIPPEIGDLAALRILLLHDNDMGLCLPIGLLEWADKLFGFTPPPGGFYFG